MFLSWKFHARGLETSFPEIVEVDQGARPIHVEGLFNPLLPARDHAIVPCGLKQDYLTHSTFVAGPNSGGKTRMMQALAFAHLLGEAVGSCPSDQRSPKLRALGPGLSASAIMA